MFCALEAIVSEWKPLIFLNENTCEYYKNFEGYFHMINMVHANVLNILSLRTTLIYFSNITDVQMTHHQFIKMKSLYSFKKSMHQRITNIKINKACFPPKIT